MRKDLEQMSARLAVLACQRFAGFINSPRSRNVMVLSGDTRLGCSKGLLSPEGKIAPYEVGCSEKMDFVGECDVSWYGMQVGSILSLFHRAVWITFSFSFSFGASKSSRGIWIYGKCTRTRTVPVELLYSSTVLEQL